MLLTDKSFRKKLLLVIVFALALCSLFSSGAYAVWQVTGKTTNRITIQTYRTEILENYKVPDAVFPGTEVDKTVRVSNTGDVDCFVRVKVETMFGTRDSSGNFTPDKELDGSLIEISYNDKYWIPKGDYWYYKTVLPAGEKTAEPLFRSFRIAETAGNKYQGKDAEIVVTMDSIQASNDALHNWEITAKDLDLINKEPLDFMADSKVSYIGGEQGFLFEGFGTDLFTNFKNLLPGCSRTQKILLSNQSEQPVVFSLYAAAAAQNVKSKQEKELLEKLLNEYAQIEIRKNGVVLYNGPVNGNPENNPGESMGEQSALSLGEILPGQEQEMIVSLKLLPEMDRAVCDLTGNIDWVFQVSGEEGDTAAVPQTGDAANLASTLAVFCISGLAVIFLYLFRKDGWIETDG